MGPTTHEVSRRTFARWYARYLDGGTETLEDCILLENYYLPGDLEAQIEAFLEHYNHQRYHEVWAM